MLGYFQPFSWNFTKPLCKRHRFRQYQFKQNNFRQPIQRNRKQHRVHWQLKFTSKTVHPAHLHPHNLGFARNFHADFFNCWQAGTVRRWRSDFTARNTRLLYLGGQDQRDWSQRVVGSIYWKMSGFHELRLGRAFDGGSQSVARRRGWRWKIRYWTGDRE